MMVFMKDEGRAKFKVCGLEFKAWRWVGITGFCFAPSQGEIELRSMFSASSFPPWLGAKPGNNICKFAVLKS
jgi:hypothetical protein